MFRKPTECELQKILKNFFSTNAHEGVLVNLGFLWGVSAHFVSENLNSQNFPLPEESLLLTRISPIWLSLLILACREGSGYQIG